MSYSNAKAMSCLSTDDAVFVDVLRVRSPLLSTFDFIRAEEKELIAVVGDRRHDRRELMALFA